MSRWKAQRSTSRQDVVSASSRTPSVLWRRRFTTGVALPLAGCDSRDRPGHDRTTCLVVDEALRPIGRGYRESSSTFRSRAGWSTIRTRSGRPWKAPPRTLWRTRACGPHELSAIGITNQRETTLVWQRRSGRPVHRAIVWQDRRTAERCAQLPADLIRERTGLVPDPYFSATKLEWILGRTDIPQRELVSGRSTRGSSGS